GLLVLALLLGAAIAAIAPPRPAGAEPASVASVLGMRFGEHGERTRFVLELSAPVPFDIFAVDQPDRLVIDFRNLIWPFDAADNSGAGLILRQRHGPSDIGTLRVVLE